MIDMLELEQAWKGLDARLARSERAWGAFERRTAMWALQARLRFVSMWFVVQLVVGLAIALWAGSYEFDHFATPHLFVYGLSIHLYGIALLAHSIVQLVWVARIDHAAPVLDVQRGLLALRRVRVRGERALLVAGFVLWVPFAFIALAAIGVDVWRTAPDVVLWNLLVGVGLSAFVAWLTHRFRERFERDALGRNLRAAEAELAAFVAGDRD